jgi:hypothetical protein
VTDITTQNADLAAIQARHATLKARAALAAALAKAQGAFAPIGKNRTVVIRSEKGNYNFEYADLEVIIAATRPALSANGLCVVQSVGSSTDGRSHLDTCVLHSEGGELVSRIPLPSLSDYRDPKQFGAALSYLRRYAYTSMLCVAADDDLDSDGQETGGSVTRPASSPDVRTAAPRTRPAASDGAEGAEGVTTGQRAWLKKKLAGRMDADKLLAEHGMQQVEDSITSAQFEALKKAVMA